MLTEYREHATQDSANREMIPRLFLKGQLRMQVTLVVWDDENKAEILALGFSLKEIEDVLYNHRNNSHYLDEMDGSLPLCLTVGIATTGRRIAVKCSFVCGNPVEVYPITARLG
jgi:hypothetical protein